MLETSEDACELTECNLSTALSAEASQSSTDEYAQFQLRIFRATLLVTAFAVAITAWSLGVDFSINVLIGALAGVLYLRLLARSIGSLGKSSKSVSKIQLLVPVLLVLAVSKLSQLELFPVLLGFLLYKPALIGQILLESRSRA